MLYKVNRSETKVLNEFTTQNEEGLAMFQIPLTCTGCHACASICPKECIVMKDTGEGFLFPVVDLESCVQCGRCEKVCPVLHEQKKSTHTQAFAMKSKDEDERRNSTSGGVFSLIAKQVIDAGGIVYGAAYDDNFSVRHISIEDDGRLTFLQGAKYVQSVIGTTFMEIEKELKRGRQVLFSGTPCQCVALKAFLGKEYDNLLTVDLICHGVSSPKVWQTYIDYRSGKENNGKRPVKINMRSKASGWSRYSTEFDYGEGKITRIQNNQDSFIRAFIGNICLRGSCSDCVAKGVERCTDLTLGDYWGVWNQNPEFNDDKGVSIVFAHSEKGKKALQQAAESAEWIEVSLEDAYRENISMISSSKENSGRKNFLEEINVENFEEVVKEYFPAVTSNRKGILKRMKKGIWGMLRK